MRNIEIVDRVRDLVRSDCWLNVIMIGGRLNLNTKVVHQILSGSLTRLYGGQPLLGTIKTIQKYLPVPPTHYQPPLLVTCMKMLLLKL